MINNMKHHPLVRTSQDIRRCLVRLKAFTETPMDVPLAERTYAKTLIEDLQELHESIPELYRDKDLRRRRG